MPAGFPGGAQAPPRARAPVSGPGGGVGGRRGRVALLPAAGGLSPASSWWPAGAVQATADLPLPPPGARGSGPRRGREVVI